MNDISKFYNDTEYEYLKKSKKEFSKKYTSLPKLYELYELYDEKKQLITNDISSKRKKSQKKYSKSNKLGEYLQYEINLYAIKDIIEELEKDILSKTQKYIPKSDYINYPQINDPNYQQKIHLKEEFNVNTVHNIDYTIEDKCSSKSFNLSNYQRFIRIFMSPDTPYNGVLLFHGTGVGKTCSAVQIAEQFKDFYPHKISVILSQSIEDGWKRTIFSPDKLNNQCLKNTYHQLLHRENKDSLIRKSQNRQVNKIIKNKYEFYGYQKFSNIINNIKKNYVKGEHGVKKRDLEIKAIRDNFSNSLLIIDEVHNIRLEDAGGNKEIRNIISNINDVITHSHNLKLVLLSATPMFNRSSEIIFLLNLLLKNDNKNPIKRNLFDDEGNLTVEGGKILIQKSQGYISYVRGEDPVTFPLRLYPGDIDPDFEYIYSNYRNNYPKLTFNGKSILPKDSLQFLTIRYSLFTHWQSRVYETSIKSIKTDKLTIMDDTILTQISNIVYPENPKNKSKSIKEYYGQKGLLNTFNIDGGKFSYKKDILQLHNHHAPLDYSMIQNFSSKIYNILNSIVDMSFNIRNGRKGIVFIYTRYLSSGAIPLALALEHMGFMKHGGNNLLDFPEYKKGDREGTCKRENISYNGLHESTTKSGKNPFKRGKYIILSGDQTYSKNNINELKLATADNNKNGEEIKIIIGTEVASEGIDLKFVREVHIMDPWRHLNKIEQIIGRGIRFCSHASLNERQRNVTVYLHSGVLDPVRESTDTYIYRQAEIKTRQIGQVEYLLKKNALDCYLFKNSNVIKQGTVPIIKKIETYKKSIGINIELYDKSFSKICSYMDKCDYTCTGKKYNEDSEIQQLDNTTNNSTFNPLMIESLISEIINHIKNIYKYNYVYTKVEIIKTIQQIKYYSDNYIVYAINKLLLNGKHIDSSDIQQHNSISNEYIITDKHNINGYLIKSDKYCVFQPFNIKDTKTPMYYRINNYKLNEISNEKYIDLDQILKERIKDIKEKKSLLFTKSPLELLDTEYSNILKKYEINKGLFNENATKTKSLDIKCYKLLFNSDNSDKLQLEYALDRLLFNHKYILLSCLNYNINNNYELNDTESKIFDYFKTLFINKKFEINDKSYRDIMKLKDPGQYLKAFTLIRKDNTIQLVLYQIINDRIIKMRTDINKINKNIEIYKKSGRFSDKNGTDYYGYVDASGEEKDIIFKYKKKTERSSKNKFPGQSCGDKNSRDKSKLCNIIEIINPDIHQTICSNFKTISPSILCFIIECILRTHDIGMNSFYKFDELYIKEPRIL